MKILFWIDPPESLNFEKDTSLLFMKEAEKRGHEIFYLPSQGLSLLCGKLYFEIFSLSFESESLKKSKKSVFLLEDDVDVVLIRKDPPFDEQYLCQTWFLDRVSHKIFISNSPCGIRNVNEKIWINQWASFTPPTLITASQRQYESFLRKYSCVVLKPYDAFAGQGVCLVEKMDSNARVLFEILSDFEKKPVVVQKYLNGACSGDKRVLVLNGKILGSLLRHAVEGDHRNNLRLGGSYQSCFVSAKEKKMIDHMLPFFQKEGLHFVGLDFIDEKLIEVNVTSPTCLREMNRLYKASLETHMIDFVEKSVFSKNLL